MGAQTQVTQRQNVATPLSRDVLGILRSQITGTSGAGGGPTLFGGDVGEFARGGGGQVGPQGGGGFGTGVGPLQREAGTAMRQFVQGLQDRVAGGADFQGREFNALRDIQAQNREEAVADVAERFGRAGNVAGTATGFAQAQTLRDLIPRQEAQLAQIRRAEEQQLMNAIGQLQQIGQQNIEPFLALASQGILAPEVTQREHPLVTGLGAVAGLAQGAGKAASGFGAGGAT